jgi:predicted DNA-binding transcriptional regulator AlpA
MRMLTFAELNDVGVRLGRRHIDTLMHEGRFPQPVRLTSRRLVWKEDEVLAWLAARVAEPYRPGPQPRPKDSHTAPTGNIRQTTNATRPAAIAAGATVPVRVRRPLSVPRRVLPDNV